MNVNLPEGWSLGRIGDLFRLVNGYPFKPSQWKDHGRPIIRIQNLNNPKAAFHHFSGNIAEKFLVRNGTLLFAWSGTPGSSFGAHIWAGETGWLNQHIFRVEFDENQLDKKFLRLAININLQNYIEEAHGGVGLAHITKSKFDASHLRLPPLAEQRRIVAKVEEILSLVNSANTRLLRITGILKRFRQAVLTAACSGRLTQDWREKNLWSDGSISSDLIESSAELDQLPEGVDPPQEWTISTLGKLITRIEAGKNVRCLECPPEVGEKGIVKISAVTWGEFNQDESKTLQDPALFVPERSIRMGDLLISRANTLDLVGTCVIVRNINRELMLSDKVLRLQAREEWKRWLLIFLRSRLGRGQIETLATGNQLSMRNITQDSLCRIVIPLPNPRERDEAVRRVEQLLELAASIGKNIDAATANCKNVTEAILAKAFRGELVLTEAELARREGRDYEPASVLLERIKKQRESELVTKPKRVLREPKLRAASAKGQA